MDSGGEVFVLLRRARFAIGSLPPNLVLRNRGVSVRSGRSTTGFAAKGTGELSRDTTFLRLLEAAMAALYARHSPNDS